MKLVQFICLLICVGACMPKNAFYWQVPAASIEKLATTRAIIPPQDYFIPDTTLLEATPVKYLRINVHFMQSTDTLCSYKGARLIEHVEFLVRCWNKTLAENEYMMLPAGNNTPKLPTQLQVVLTPQPDIEGDLGIYEHYDDSLCWGVIKGKHNNFFKKTVFEKYNIGSDSILNIFMIPHHPDSVLSKTYNKSTVGAWLNSGIKMIANYMHPEETSGAEGFVHEIGHALGLYHTWNGEDGCDDTPRNKNCFGINPAAGCPVDSTSNNLMDYNTWQRAITPCQIGTMQRSMCLLDKHARKWVVKDWCDPEILTDVHVTEDKIWKGGHDLHGSVIIYSGAKLTIAGRVHLPKNAEIIVEPGGTLELQDGCFLHNDCGNTWRGIRQKNSKNAKSTVLYSGSNIRIENMKVQNLKTPDKL